MSEESSNNLMDDLAAAWDEEETEDAVQQTDDTAPTEQLSEVVPESDDTVSADAELVSEPEGSGESKEADAGSVETDTPPVGLPPAAREAWKDAPPAIKEAIAKREADYAAGIQQHAENAKRAQAMDKVLAPYQQYFAMNGNSPGQSINQLLQTASLLQMGNPVQRAETVANLIKQFGVDIKTLDNLLVGQAPPEGVQQNTEVQQQIQQALAPYQQVIGQFQQQQQQTVTQQHQAINNELDTFAKDPQHEFYNDVNLDMADILEMAGKRGHQMSLKEAYDKACQLHPQIGPIMQARKGAGAVRQKQSAAASIHGSPGGPGAVSEPDSLHSAITAAWDNAGQM
jgi:hypothetical protein